MAGLEPSYDGLPIHGAEAVKIRKGIVLVTTSYPRSGDGSEAAGGFVFDLAGELSCRCPVRVVAPADHSGVYTDSNGAKVYAYRSPRKPLSTLNPLMPIDTWRIWSVLNAGREATMLAATSQPTSHILALWVLPSGYWAKAVSAKTGIPYSTWALGSDIWTLARLPIVRKQLTNVLRTATKCYADGIGLAADTSRIGMRGVDFLPTARSLPVRSTRLVRRKPPYRLTFLGRWHPNKGIDLLLDALDCLQPSSWEKVEEVVICGGGPMARLVHAGVERMAKAGRPVSMTGYLDKKAALERLDVTDYLLLPSRVESIPVVFSDALKRSCALISTPVGDMPAFLEGAESCGVVADSVSAIAFAKAIEVALDNAPADFIFGIEQTRIQFEPRNIAARLWSELSSGSSEERRS